MEANGIDALGALLLAGITFPVSYVLARLCLRGVLRIVTQAGAQADRP